MKKAFDMVKSLPPRSWFLVHVCDEAARQAAERCGRGRGRGSGASTSINNPEMEIAKMQGSIQSKPVSLSCFILII